MTKRKYEKRTPANPTLEEYGRQLRRLREAKNWTQEGVAELLSRDFGEPVTDSWVSDVERGRLDVSLTKLVALAERLDARVDLPAVGDLRQRVIQAVTADREALGADGLTAVLGAYEALRPPRREAKAERTRTA